MRIKCTTLIAAVLTACLPLAAQRPGANPPAGNQPNSNQSANNQPSANGQTGATQTQVLNSELFVARADSSIFTMKLDEHIFGAPAKSFNLTNLTPGFHHIQLLKPVAATGPRLGSQVPEVLYDGYVNVPEGSRVTAISPQRNQLNIVSIVPIIQAIYGILTGQNGQTGNGGWGQGTGGGWGWPPLGPQGMASGDFELLKSTINGKTFDSDKLSVLKMAMLNNHFTANQVTQLVSLFDFESNKVAVAKALYGRVVDKGNYYLVNNAFNFSSSSEELSDYITGSAGL